MPITIVTDSLIRSSGGSKIRVNGRAVFTTYETGGPVLNASAFGLDQIHSLTAEQRGGFQIDPLVATNQLSANILVFSGTGGGTITTTANELVAVVADTGTLAAVPASVQSVQVTAGALMGPFLIVPSTIVPASGQVSINLATRVLTFNAVDVVTAATVTYILAALGAGASGEVANGTNLAGIGNVAFEAIGI